jgi:hypothetical protein
VAAAPTARDPGPSWSTPTGKVTASVTVACYSVSLRVTSIPPPKWVTRL